jgi:hypothetical protein
MNIIEYNTCFLQCKGINCMGHEGCHLYSIVHASSLLIATLETLRCCRHRVAILLFVA